MIKKGLGKGLDALFSVYEDNDKEIEQIQKYEEKNNITQTNTGVLEVNLSEITPNPNQPRKNFDQTALEELRDSIKMHGVIQPIVLAKNINGGYIIIAGERRFRASQMANLKAIPAIIKDYTERQIKEIALIENLQREDLNPIETAKALRDVMLEYNMTQDEIADRIGKSRSAIANTLRLLSLTNDVIKLVENGKLSAGHARTLVAVVDPKAQLQLALKASEGKMSVRDLEKAVKDYLNPPVKKKKLEREQSLELKELVNDMQKVFSTKVSVLGSDNKGRIYIDYFSKDDLNRICELIEFLRSRN